MILPKSLTSTSTIYRCRQLDYFNDEINRLIKTAKVQSSDRMVRDIDEIKDNHWFSLNGASVL